MATYPVINNPSLTFKSFIDDLISTLQTHKQINSVAAGNLSDFSFPKTPETSIVFPYVFLVIDENNCSITMNANTGMSYPSITFPIIICDQYVDTQESIIGIQSNCIDIANDILIYFSNVNGCGKPYRIQLPQTPKIVPFAETTRENLAGATLNVTWMIEQPMSNQYPMFG